MKIDLSQQIINRDGVQATAKIKECINKINDELKKFKTD
jgi:endonuclease V-like protein UPF0215 family